MMSASQRRKSARASASFDGGCRTLSTSCYACYMRTIPHRELRNNSSRILREVAQGATFEITNHGDVVAILSPPNGEVPAERLEIRPARGTGKFSDLPRVKLDHPIQEDLDYLRGDR
jgi:prevent-host-death family protein